MNINELERIEYTNAYLRNVCGKKLLICDDGNYMEQVINYLSEFDRENINIDEVVSSKINGSCCEIFVTFSEDEVANNIENVSGDYLTVLELLIEGTGIARSYESLHNLYNELEDNGINVLGQICSDLKLRLFLPILDREKVLISLSHLNISISR